MLDAVVATDEDCALGNMLEFAHVSRPSILLQVVEDGRVDMGNGAVEVAGKFFYEMVD